jgi:hypothetical protein
MPEAEDKADQWPDCQPASRSPNLENVGQEMLFEECQHVTACLFPNCSLSNGYRSYFVSGRFRLKTSAIVHRVRLWDLYDTEKEVIVSPLFGALEKLQKSYY